MRITLLSGAAVVALITLTTQNVFAAADSDSDGLLARQVDVVEAVGAIRYFHPHDAVTVVNWNSVLLEGFELAEQSSDEDDFSASLAQLLGQIGTGIVQRDADRTNASITALECGSDEKPVRWVHQGFGAPPAAGQGETYLSRRSGAQAHPDLGPQAFSNAMTMFSARPWRGKRLFFSSQARVPDGGEGAMWIRVNDRNREILVFDNMDDRRITQKDWEEEGLVFSVPSDAERIAVGMISHGTARVEFRDIDLREVDQETEQPREESVLPELEQWRTFSPPGVDDPEMEVTEEGMFVTLTPGTGLPPVDDSMMALFEDAPTSGSLELVDGSRLQFPLALCPEDTQMAARRLTRLAKRFAEIDVGELSVTERARLDVATLWPVIQHFYPYRDNLHDWPGALETALRESRSINDSSDHRRILQRLMVHAEDGHVRVHETQPEEEEEAVAWLPIAVVPVDGDWIVARSDSPEQVRPGDRIAAIDGETVQDWLAQEMAHFSGSRQWRTFRAIRTLLRGQPDDSRNLSLLRDGESFESSLSFELEERLGANDLPPTREAAEGITYINLTAIDQATLSDMIPELVDARGVIFDLRGYPRGIRPDFLGHLMASDDDFTDWMKVMVARAPNGNLVTAGEYEWSMETAEPHIEAPVVFLTDYRAISYAESMIGMIKYHDLGTVVGSNTAGANGNVLPLQLPGGFTVSYTGMFVVGPDGEPFHGRGIEPDVGVAPTLEGLREGRDEVLERALEIFGD
ncbi:S41 family peptidase [Wenzhouxiangella sp. EGI_FJ10305]|uniref:S41 family peptidase n=1 Tax=Wenzhouxiangella sp. EGI_FJ10305 TaxID=3243768 RepID=UPI0035E116CE